MTQNLADKVVIITGASSGIGAACARLLAQQGCKLTLAARRVDEMQRLADQLAAESLVVRADMTAPADISHMVARTLERFGRVDALLANAGVYIHGQFAEGDIEDLTRMFTLNVDGALRCAHAVIPSMKAQEGRRHHRHQFNCGPHGHSGRAGLQRQQERRANLRAYGAPPAGRRWHPRHVTGARSRRQPHAEIFYAPD